MFGLQVAAYLTWEGKLIEGKGVAQVVNVERSRTPVGGRRSQMERVLPFLREICTFVGAGGSTSRVPHLRNQVAQINACRRSLSLL